MEISIERIAAITSCLYFMHGELVEDRGHKECYLFFDGIPQKLLVSYEEIDYLEAGGLIELDGGKARPP